MLSPDSGRLDETVAGLVRSPAKGRSERDMALWTSEPGSGEVAESAVGVAVTYACWRCRRQESVAANGSEMEPCGDVFGRIAVAGVPINSRSARSCPAAPMVGVKRRRQERR